MNSNIWQLQDAKSRLSELVDQTLSEGTQIITRRGRKTVALIPFDEYERVTRQQKPLSQFLLESPLAGPELSIERDKSLPRDFEIEP
ncbi:MAG TPA: type II toxin-antitoxin system Phd/YefM family antitoxin [Anaerolineaceae bacterium]|nr:type II toxin-antitoxin system Phd/YefM family antitoxin [Anaerolineaceae bacterium]